MSEGANDSTRDKFLIILSTFFDKGQLDNIEANEEIKEKRKKVGKQNLGNLLLEYSI